MKRVLVSILTLLVVFGVVGYASGLLTGEVRKEEACILCRAWRLSGEHYGFAYSRVDDSSVTAWYRQNIDPMHGLSPDHPHTWEQSACLVNVRPGWGTMDYVCTMMPTVFLLRPDIELEALLHVPDKTTQINLIHSLDSPDRRDNAKRVRTLIEYYYIDRHQTTWNQWWKSHAQEFGLSPMTASL
jgi:hypothetical protein